MKVTPATRQTVLERDQYRCSRCGTYVGPFGHYSVHHRQPRGMGGSKRPESNSPANLLVLCGSGTTGCHGHIESHRTDAEDRGFIVRRPTDPATVPVESWRGRIWLDNDGTFTTEDPR